jgi:hypothetical protein
MAPAALGVNVGAGGRTGHRSRIAGAGRLNYYVINKLDLARQGREELEMDAFTSVKVFTATKAKEREELGEEVTRWIEANPGIEIVDKVVQQSSDEQYHCLTIVLFYRRP